MKKIEVGQVFEILVNVGIIFPSVMLQQDNGLMDAERRSNQLTAATGPRGNTPRFATPTETAILYLS